MSEWTDMTSGIPQGSVLGSLLFLIFINVIPDNLESSIKIFADDTKAYRDVRSAEDTLGLQRDVDQLGTWSERWQLMINPLKCNHMTYGKWQYESR